FRLGDFDTGALGRTWKASLAFFGLWICINIIYVQVPRLLVFQFFGAAALATFTVLVTYTRAARMIALMVPQAAQVEIGLAFGDGQTEQFKKLVETAVGWAVVVAAVVLGIAMVLAPFVVPVWTRGHVAVEWGLFTALAVSALVGTYFD